MKRPYCFRMDNKEIEEVLDRLPTGERSEYIRKALEFYYNFGALLAGQNRLLAEQNQVIREVILALKGRQPHTGPVGGSAGVDDLLINSLGAFG